MRIEGLSPLLATSLRAKIIFVSATSPDLIAVPVPQKLLAPIAFRAKFRRIASRLFGDDFSEPNSPEASEQREFLPDPFSGEVNLPQDFPSVSNSAIADIPQEGIKFKLAYDEMALQPGFVPQRARASETPASLPAEALIAETIRKRISKSGQAKGTQPTSLISLDPLKKSKNGRPFRNEAFEKELLRLVREQMPPGSTASRKFIKRLGERVKHELKISDDRLKLSKGWLDKFVVRHHYLFSPVEKTVSGQPTTAQTQQAGDAEDAGKARVLPATVGEAALMDKGI